MTDGTLPSMGAPDRRSRAAAWMAAVLLAGLCVLNWNPLLRLCPPDSILFKLLALPLWNPLPRPSYAGAVLFQSAALALLAVAAYPWAARFGRMPAAAWLLAAYGAWLLASTLWARLPMVSLKGSPTALTGIVWALLIGAALSDRRDLRRVFRGIFFAGALGALVAILFVIGEHNFGVVEQVFGHRNFLAIFLLPPLLLGAAEFLAPVLSRAPGTKGPLALPLPAAGACMALMFGALLACRSVGAMMGLGAGLLALGAMRLSRRRRVALLAGGAALLAAGLIAVALVSHSSRFMRSHQATRWFMWEGVARMVADHPLRGWGTGMFAFEFPPYKPTEPMRYGWLTSATVYPHDELLLVAAEGGLVALALYLCAHALAAGGVLREAEAAAPDVRVAGWALLAAGAAMFAHGLVEVALRFWAPAAMYWTLMGLALAWPRLSAGPSAEAPRPAGRARWAIFSAALAAALALAGSVVWCGARSEHLLGAWGVSEMAAHEESVRVSREAMRLCRYPPDLIMVALPSLGKECQRAKDMGGAVAAYEELDRLAPGFGPVRDLIGAAYGQWARQAGPEDPEAGRRHLTLAIEWFERALKMNRYDLPARRSLAADLLAASRRNLPAALEHARVAAETAPLDRAQAPEAVMKQTAEARFFYGILLFASGRPADAAKELDEALKACPPDDEKLRGRIEEERQHEGVQGSGVRDQ